MRGCVSVRYLSSEDACGSILRSIMDLRVVCVVACLCALALASAEAGIPKCCISTRTRVDYSLLRRHYRVEKQESTGACDIEAMLLYVRGRRSPICVSPKVFDRLKKNLDKLKA